MEQNEVYQATMREAASAAWDEDWPAAIQAYQRVLSIAPNDPQAMAGLALSLLSAGQYDKALLVYQRVNSLVPSDPLPREKIGEIFSRQAKRSEAAQSYLEAGEIYLARKDIPRAIYNWEQAILHDPSLAQAHMRLAVAYESKPETRKKAVNAYLQVARLLQRKGQLQRAEQAVNHALELDPINTTVRNALNDLKQGLAIQVDESFEISEAPPPATGPLSPVDTDDIEEKLLEEDEDAGSHTPAGDATRLALGELADIIWSGEATSEAQSAILKGIDAHQVEDIDSALDSFSQAASTGLNHPALNFILGTLHSAKHRHAEAINALAQAAETEKYSIASNLMLGQHYYTDGKLLPAATYLFRALQSADADFNPQEVDRGGYARMLSSLQGQKEDYLSEFIKALAFYLDTPDWQEKLKRTLTNYAEQKRVSYVPDLVELIIEGGRPELGSILERIDLYVERNLLHLATEEAHYAIERVPDYLPAHQRLADILIKETRTQKAAEKINLIANTYLIRGNSDKAADLFSRAIDLWPADTSARQRVIDMLKEQKRSSEALRHYAELAELYYRLMADPNKSIAIYDEALRYARETDAEPKDVIPILKALADIESQRLNWRKALSYYERVVELNPGDNSAVLSVIELRFQLNEVSDAIRTLDNYIRHCIQNGMVDRIIPLLEDQVRHHPDAIPLRQRLAEVYRQQGRLQDAITQLDALGELQLDVGKIDDAVVTIRKIISLNPPDVSGYHQLLKELESGKS